MNQKSLDKKKTSYNNSGLINNQPTNIGLVDKKKPKELPMIHKQPSVLSNKKSETQTKELDWTDIVKNIFFANGVKCDSEQFLIEDILALLTQQRTELLEEIKENVNHKVCPMCFGYLTVSSTGGKCSDCGYCFGTSADNTNLLNNKDE